MRRKWMVFLLAGTLGLSLAGCQGGSSGNTQKQEAANEAAEDQNAEIGDMGTGEEEILTADEPEELLYETETPLEPINPSEYLIKDAADYVTLGDYAGIPVEKTVYVIRDSEEEPYQEKDFFLTIGYEEYGAEFDEKVTGASKGDKLEFSISYSEDDEMIEWAGKTVDFVFEVTGVYSLNVPEYTEDFVVNTLGFETKAAFESYIREMITQEYEDMSYTNAVDVLFDEAIARTEFKEYPQELYDACREETVGFYASFSGAEKEEDIYEMFGITEEDINEEVLSLVNRRLLVSAYCLANGIEVTEDEYVSYLQDNAFLYGEPDAASFESIYGRESLVWTMYESRFSEALYEQADVTEVSYDPSAEEEAAEFSSEG